MDKGVASCIKDHYRRETHQDSPSNVVKSELLVKNKGEHFLKACGQNVRRVLYNDIFKNGERVTRVLVEGGAGLGKSTFCVSVTREWSNDSCFQEYDLLLSLPLGQQKVASSSSFRDLVKNLKIPKVNSRDVEKYLQKKNGDGVLLVADGWNELDESKRLPESFFYKLLFGELFSSLSVIVTSRSTASASFHRDECTAIHRFIEICGFDEQNVKSYVQSELAITRHAGIDSLLNKMEYNPLLEKFCRIPLSCSVVCKLWHILDGIIDSGVTELCTNVMLNILSSSCQRQMPGNPVNISSLPEIDRLPQSLREAWWQLCEVAFQNISNKSVHSSQLYSYQVGTMMYSLVEFDDTKDESDVSLNFVYPSSQEYLAALHFVKQPPDNQLKSLETIKVTCKEFPMFWRYLFGLAAESKVLLGALETIVTVEPPKCLLCQCAFEAKNDSITSKVIECLSDKVESETIIQFSDPSSAFDCDAMLYIMTNMKNSKCKEIIKMEINFSSCGLSVQQIHTLADALASAPEKMAVKDLDLSDNNLGDESVAHLFTKAASSFVSLKKLFIGKNDMGESGLTAVIKALAKSSSRTLTQLDLSSNSLTLTSFRALNGAIKSGVLSKLEILFMRECFTSNVNLNVEYFIDLTNNLLSHCVQLRRLDLRGNDLGKSATPRVSVVIKRLSKSLDLILNREYMSEVDNTFVGIMEDTVRNKGTIDHTVVHGVIVGPGRSGKNSLVNRLMHQGPLDQDTISPSTGVLENVKKVEVKKMCTVAAAVSNLRWRPLDYDEEALELIMVTAKSYTASDEAVPLSTDAQRSKSKDVVEKEKSAVKNDESATEETDSTETSEPSEILRLSEGHIVQMTSGGGVSERRIAISQDIDSGERPLDMFKRAVKLRRMDALREHLESSWTLYLTNTGGQIEFQEHLPLLVCGPSVFFVTFPLNQSLDEHYTVYYQYKDGSHKQYPSPSTLMQEILQLLATIAALDCTGPCSDVNLKPKVFFVGTHRDQLPESCVYDRIQQIDKQLQDVVRQTSLFRQDSIEFAVGKEQMIFTVNNLSKDDKDFEKIRLGLQKAVERGKEFTITCPSTWLIFSLILRAKHESSRVLSYYDCLVIAKQCGIMDGMELNKALLFIHSTLGLVRYFCVDKLNELVVIDPQILFDTFTTLLTEMFTDYHATVNEIEKFKERGIISKKVIERISAKKCAPDTKSLLPLGWLLDLLIHLRIAVPFKINNEECFFFPSTLFNAPEKDKSISSIANEPPPLQIAFEGGFCPRGIPGALITYLMSSSNEVTIKSRYSWELHSNRVFKNQVSFSVGPCDIILKISCTHIEVKFDPESSISLPSDVVTTCEEAFTQLQEAMNTVTKGFRGCKYYLAFNCTRHECEDRLHPAEIDWTCMRLNCTLTKRRGCFPKSYHIWFPKEKEGISQWLDQVIDFGNKSAKHLGQIADTMTEWEGKIAEELQLSVADVAAIKTEHPTKLKLQTRAALEMWKQRLGDNATYNNLIRSFELAGFQQLADTVKKFEPDVDRNLSMDSITSPQRPNSPPPPEPVFPITVPTVLLELEGQGAVDRLEEKFSDIQKRLLAELNKNSKLSPEDLVNSLTLLPIALRTEYQKFISENLQALQRVDSITNVFHHINPLLSFIDYSLLAHLVKEHGSEQLQGEMAAYAHLVEEFLGVTTVERLADYWPGRQDTPPHFERLTAVVSGDPGTYTLHEVNTLRKKFCCETSLTETVLVLIGVGKKNSFSISWIVPSMFVSQLKSVVGKLKSFYQREHIMSVTLSGQQIYPIEVTPKERLVALCVEGPEDISEIQYLLSEKGVDPNLYDKDGYSLLSRASSEGRTDLVQLLLDYGANIDLPDDDEWGCTALIMACIEGHVTTAALLINRGAAVNYLTKKGEHALSAASQYGRIGCVKLLLQQGAVVDLPSDNDLGFTALMDACQEGQVEVADLLIERGAEVEYHNKQGATPLTMASQYGHNDVVQLLLDRGAGVDHPMKDEYGQTPLMLASRMGHSKVMMTLISRGAVVDHQTKDGWSPLLLACDGGQTEVVEILLKHGARLDIKNKAGRTPRTLATRGGHKEIIDILTKAESKMSEVRPMEAASSESITRVASSRPVKESNKIDEKTLPQNDPKNSQISTQVSSSRLVKENERSEEKTLPQNDPKISGMVTQVSSSTPVKESERSKEKTLPQNDPKKSPFTLGARGLSASFAKFFRGIRRSKATAEGLTTSEGRGQREASPLSPGESGSHGEESLPEALTPVGERPSVVEISPPVKIPQTLKEDKVPDKESLLNVPADKDVKLEVLLVSKKVEVEPSLQPVKELPRPPQQTTEVEIDFVERPSKEFFCPVTFELLLMPHLTTCCGHHLSERAVKRLKQENKPCPLCKEPELATVLDKFHQRRIREVRVRCPHTARGCEWVGEVGQLNSHTDSCLMRHMETPTSPVSISS